MTTFNRIWETARERKGGEEQLQRLLPPVLASEELAKKGDDRFLAMICKTVNQAGFNWTVIENKWPEFEEAFHGFSLEKLALLSQEQWDNYLEDKRVVRSRQKIEAMRQNVNFVVQTAKAHGSFAKFIAHWPTTDQIGLMAYLKKEGSRLGGSTSQWFLRYVGKDCFIITKDVCQVIRASGFSIDENPTSNKDLKTVQEVFNAWHEETNLPFSHLSKIAAYSSGANYDNDTVEAEIKKLSSDVAK